MSPQSRFSRPTRTALLSAVFGGWLLAPAWPSTFHAGTQDKEQDHYRKWLREDVLYIITPEESDVFLKLTTDQERELFIEQFWGRRDSDPWTSLNEYKEEHYRRIAFANENFTSGFPGWKSDRGMVYIKYGEPHRRERHPTGGHYLRPSREGGGSTSTYPFERWEYRYLDGIGRGIELEFVDPSLTGEYRLTTNTDEKDALLLTPNAGLTDAEMLGLVKQKIDRIVRKTSPMPGHNALVYGYGRARDQPFEKLHLMTNLEKATVVSIPDLRSEVATRVDFTRLPFQLQSEVFRRVDEGRVVLILHVNAADLQFRKVSQEYRAQLDVQTVVKSVAGHTVKISGDSLVARIPETVYGHDKEGPLIFQKDILLPAGRYKLEVFVRDRIGNHLGFNQSLVIVPESEGRKLSLSSVLLARRIETVPAFVESGTALTSFRIWPIVGNSVPRQNRKLGFYFEVYDFKVDQSTGKPVLELSYEILDSHGNSWPGAPEHHFTDQFDQRVTIMSILKASHLQPGTHRLRIRVRDRISGQHLIHSREFVLE